MKSFNEFLYIYYNEEDDYIDIACYTYLKEKQNKPTHYFACNLNNISKQANDFDNVKKVLLNLIC